MAQTITMNYRGTLKKAQELEELADEMDRKCAARIDRLRDGMRSNWTGDSLKVSLETGPEKCAQQLQRFVLLLRGIAFWR